MTVPYDYDQTNTEHLRAVIAEQEQTIKYLHEHCKAEEAENAKLRKQSEQLFDKTLELGTENAKLRELVRDMWGCISHIGEYDVFYYDMAEDGCGMSCTVNGEHCCADKLHYRMRELGVDA